MQKSLMGLVPETVHRFARVLIDAGHATYLVGGAVRNILCGRPPSDWDIATDATPDRVQKLYRRTVPTGIRHGTVTVLFQGGQFEVTTFRMDSVYSDGRRPDTIRFTATIEEDLARRDFTINAIAVDLASGDLHDPHGGRADLAARRLRTVGDASERFAEDGLRPFRACRLAAELNLSIDAPTVRSMRDAMPTARRVAAERICEELRRLMMASTPSVGLHLLDQSGLMSLCFPARTSDATKPSSTHAARYGHLHSAPANVTRRLAMLLAPRASADALAAAAHARTALTRLRFPNAIVNRVAAAISGLAIPLTADSSDARIRRLLTAVGRDGAADAIAVRQALDSIDERLVQRVRSEAASTHALSIQELAVDGTDLQRTLGLPPGPWIGLLLDALLQKVLDDPAANDRTRLLKAARVRQSEEVNAPDTASPVPPSSPTSSE